MTKRLVYCALGGVLSALLWWAAAHASEPVDFCVLWVGDSLSDVVRESEDDQMPSQEEFDRRGGEANQAVPPVQQPAQPERTLPEGDSTPPRAPDAGGPGRAVPEERRLTAWAFGVWGADGGLRSGGMFADPDECLFERTRGQSRYPRLTFGPCVELVHGRETL